MAPPTSRTFSLPTAGRRCDASRTGAAHRPVVGVGRADVSKLVILQTLGSILVGIAIGLTGALMATRLIASRLYGVATLDPATFLGAGFVLVSPPWQQAMFLPVEQ